MNAGPAHPGKALSINRNRITLFRRWTTAFIIKKPSVSRQDAYSLSFFRPF